MSSSNMFHPLAGIVFPAQVQPFARGDLTRYDTFGHNLGVAYHGTQALDGVGVTVFVYPAASKPDDKELESAIGAIFDVDWNAQLLAHGRQVLGEMEGLWASFEIDNIRESQSPRVRTGLWLFQADGWFVKYRCTDWAGAVGEDWLSAIQGLAGSIGVPVTSRRLRQNHRAALERSRDAMKALNSWLPRVAPEAAGLQRRIAALRSEGRHREALVLVEGGLAAGLPPSGLQAELGRLQLLLGEFTDAAEACMAEEEFESNQAAILEAALNAFTPDTVTYGGDWGTTPEAAVIVNDAATASTRTTAVHRFLEFTLGVRGREWKLNRASLLSHQGALYDAMEVLLCSGESIVVFFLVDDREVVPVAGDQTLGCFVTGGTVRGEPPSLSDSGSPRPTSQIVLGEAPEELPAEFHRYVAARMVQHASQTLVVADDEML